MLIEVKDVFELFNVLNQKVEVDDAKLSWCIARNLSCIKDIIEDARTAIAPSQEIIDHFNKIKNATSEELEKFYIKEKEVLSEKVEITLYTIPVDRIPGWADGNKKCPFKVPELMFLQNLGVITD